jgi:hypothetical protein
MKTPQAPFQAAAADYLMAGWPVLWLPFASKGAPPQGFTGADGIDADEETVLGSWFEDEGNIAIRMPKNIIGIDIDRDKKTGKKTGWENLQKLVKKLGPLDIDFVMSNQGHDIENGFTAFFEVPEGVKFKGGLAKIDIITRAHRYQVAAPSIHPDGPRYEWISWSSKQPVDFIPEADSFPMLPQAWVDFLTRPEAPVRAAKPSGDQLPASVDFDALGDQCAAQRAIVGKAVNNLKGLQISRHDEMVRQVFIIILNARQGHTGMAASLEGYFKAWQKTFSADETTERNIRAEFFAAVFSAKEKISGNEQGKCDCDQKTTKASTYVRPVRKVRSMADIRRFR